MSSQRLRVKASFKGRRAEPLGTTASREEAPPSRIHPRSPQASADRRLGLRALFGLPWGLGFSVLGQEIMEFRSLGFTV